MCCCNKVTRFFRKLFIRVTEVDVWALTTKYSPFQNVLAEVICSFGRRGIKSQLHEIFVKVRPIALSQVFCQHGAFVLFILNFIVIWISAMELYMN